MTPKRRWDRVKAAFLELAELGPEERASRMASLAETDAVVRRDVARLLAAHDRADALLGRVERLLSHPAFEPIPPAGDATSAPDPHGLVGRKVSHYEVDEVLGAGGMGVVYRATDTRLGRAAALKFLPPRWGLDAAFKRRFLREARAAAALDHPHVCAIYEVGETEEGQLFIAMALYRGETVKDRIARGPLAIEEALDLARQAADGLAAAHRARLVHRDIKPANLMVTEEGTLKILDFGLAKTAESALTEPDVRLGTPAYMSPEQARGDVVDTCTDVWSLGVVLYEMLTGRRPIRGGNDAAVLDAIRRAEPQPPSDLRPDLPPDMERLVLSLLSKDPQARRAGTAPLSEALGAALTAHSRTGGWRLAAHRRYPWLLGGVAAAALALALGLGPGLPSFGPSAPAGASDLVAVLPWMGRGGGVQLEPLREGLSNLLSSRLGELRGIRTVDPRAIVRFAETSCDDPSAVRCGEGVSERFRAGRFVMGTVVPGGGGSFELAASIYDGGGTELSRTAVRGHAGEPLVAVEELGRRVAAELFTADDRVPGAVGERLAVAARTTTSLPALEAYLEGEALFRAGRYPDAITALREAVATDSGFTLA